VLVDWQGTWGLRVVFVGNGQPVSRFGFSDVLARWTWDAFAIRERTKGSLLGGSGYAQDIARGQ